MKENLDSGILHLQPLEKLSTEQKLGILSNLDMGSLVKFAGTNQSNRQLVSTDMRLTICAILRHFELVPDLFFRLLYQTDAVVSGSAALLVFFPNDFLPGDVDIYVPQRSIIYFLRKLTTEFAYVVDEERACEDDPRASGLYEGVPNPAIDRVYWYRKGNLKINIISTDSVCAIEPIMHFHSTLVMNFFSFHGAYCAYPKLTLSRIGIANVGRSPPPHIAECLAKYESRGFNIIRTLSESSAHADHVCGQSMVCPQTIRSLYDNGSLFVPFDITGLLSSNVYVYNRQHSLVWRLVAGKECANQRPISGPFVKTVDVEPALQLFSP